MLCFSLCLEGKERDLEKGWDYIIRELGSFCRRCPAPGHVNRKREQPDDECVEGEGKKRSAPFII